MTSTSTTPKTSAERMREHRTRMREKGFVQKTIWLPDMNNPEVQARYRRQAEILGAMELTEDDKAWIAHSEAMLKEAWEEEDRDSNSR